MKELIINLKKHDLLKTGRFTLKSGETSDVYLNLRELTFYPELFRKVAAEMACLISSNCDAIIGVPWGAVPLATEIAQIINQPLWILRKAEKAYGDGSALLKKQTDGSSRPTQTVTLIEDVITTGSSTIEAIERLQSEGVEVAEVCAACVRNSDAIKRINALGIRLRYLFTLEDISTKAETDSVTIEKQLRLTSFRKTPLIFSADAVCAIDLFELIEELAPVVKIFKIHADVIQDFNQATVTRLNQLKSQYGLYFIEDRKFADIGAIMVQQLENSSYRYTEWADAVIGHGIAGAESVAALDKACNRHGMELILLGEMSTSANLIDEDYTQQVIDMLPKLIACTGLVLQRRPESLSNDYFVLTPGVKLEKGQDASGQRYKTPAEVIEAGTDFCIVGRGIRLAAERKSEAQAYIDAMLVAIAG